MTSSPLGRLRTGLVILMIIFLVATTGYRLAGWSWIDSIYMVVITLSTVGYREVGPVDTPILKLFTSVVILVGVSTAFYIFGGLVQMMAEGEINRALGARKATRDIQRMNNHIVICGFGRMGQTLAHELTRHGRSFVVIENDADRLVEAASLSYLALNDDSTEEDALQQAGVARAETLVTTLPRDADNVFITLTARNLNPKLTIIARGEYETTEKKLIQAGADRVVMPAATGARRMAAMITRPSAVELIEVVSGRGVSEVQVDEMTIREGSPLDGITVRESQTRSRHGLLIVAVRHAEGRLEFNPGADTVLKSGGSIVVMGKPEDIDRFRNDNRV